MSLSMMASLAEPEEKPTGPEAPKELGPNMPTLKKGNAGYDEMLDLRNYSGVSIKDRWAMVRYRFLDGDLPLFIRKNLMTLPRKVYVQTELPDSMVHEQDGARVPRQQYPRNKIRTTKYTPFNFIPKNLFFQFGNAANGYFLFCVILGAFQIFGVALPALNAVPLIVIVFLTAVRDAFEDLRRGILDTELNNLRIHLATGLENPNMAEDNVLPWRRFKKANTRSFRKFYTRYIKKMFTKKKGHQSNELMLLQSQRESLNTIGSSEGGSLYNNRLLIQTSRFLNARDKVSPVMEDTIVDPAKEPSGAVKFRNKSWKDIYVGDIVRVRQNEEVPADIVLLLTSNEDQNCYIETKNLDGETNLKSRQALKCGGGIKYGNDVERVHCWVECDAPNPNLFQFKGAIHYPRYGTNEELIEPVNIDNVLFRGTTLRNTKWVIGLVLYTGSETKIMLNSGITPSKKSRIAHELNLLVYINFALLFVLCFVSGVINGIFYNETNNLRIYYEFEPYTSEASVSGVVAFFVAIILYQSLVPISLYISVEIIKTVQAFFIWLDIKMYYDKLDFPCTPKSWNISDDLGQVEYIFLDKTGTLTQNSMEFKKCSVGMLSYGQCYTEAKMGMQRRLGIDVVKEKARMDVVIRDDLQEMKRLLSENKEFFNGENDQTHLLRGEESTFVSADYVRDVLGHSPQKKLNEWFMTCLALCHTAVTEESETGEKLIKAESPDESALVGVARDVGIEFRGKTKDTMYVTRYGNEIAYRVLRVLPFDSTRKRMSIICEVPGEQLPNPQNGRVIVVLTKGADNVIFERLARDLDEALLTKTSLYLEQFSKEGLRTLCIAYKVIPEKYFRDWDRRYHEASVLIDADRESKMEVVALEMERDFTLIGTTAIEDRLQDGVPDLISLFRQAGIKLWVLTGDKIETAINIGFLCNLLGSEMKLLVISTVDDYGEESGDSSSQGSSVYNKRSVHEIVDSQLDEYLRDFGIDASTEDGLSEALTVARDDHLAPPETHAVIVDGASLNAIFDDGFSSLKKKFLLLCKNCRSVLCCRVSPAQKAQVVKATKETFNVMTLAIGDGANDVAMIQAANIGIGIAGEEGRQAVMSSDYGLGQFRFLTRLVLVHGRWSYKRLAEMIPCFFYKNVVFSLTLFWYGVFVNFDGTYLFEYTLIMFYNLAFTSLPIIFLAVLDQDVSDTVSLLIPELYRSGILRLEWSQWKFLFYMFDGLYQLVLSFFFPYLLYYRGAFTNAQGLVLHHRFWMGTMVSAISVILCNIYVLLQQKRWDWLSGIIYAFSVLILFFWVGVWSLAVYLGEYYKAASQVFGTLTFWCVFFVGILLNLLPRFTYDTIKMTFFPKDIDIIRERVKMGCYKGYPRGYDPTDARDVAALRALQEKSSYGVSELSSSTPGVSDRDQKFGDTDGNLDNETLENANQEAGLEAELEPETLKNRQQTLKNVVTNPIGSIRRKFSVLSPKKGVSPLEAMRATMIRSGEYVGSRTSLSTHEVPGLSHAASLMLVHSRRSSVAAVRGAH